MNGPSVSVIIPTYNRASLIGRAIRSALVNVGPDDEIIVVDDGSTDDTEAVVAGFGPAVRYVRTQNGGAGAARNRGVKEATRDLVALLDSDDEWWPDKLQLQRRLMAARPDVVSCFSDFRVKLDSVEEQPFGLIEWHFDRRPWSEILGPGVAYSALGPLPAGRADFKVYIGDLYRTLLHGNYVATFTYVVRRSAGQAIRFADDVPIQEDWECFARVARLGNTAYMETETAWNYGHAGPRVTDTSRLKRARAKLKVMQRIWGADAEFLSAHRAEYEHERVKQHRIAAVWLLSSGQGRAALEELEAAGSPRFSERVLGHLPGPVLRGAFQLHRTLRGR